MVIVAGPPCTAFANLSKINKWKYPESYNRSWEIGLVLARFMAKVCRIQMDENRYFLIENPAGSELFQLPEFERLWKTNKVGKIIFPQCGLGLVTPEGEPIHKPTELWANAKELLQPFEGIMCMFDRHGEMVGTYQGQQRSKLAQVWPPEFCRRIVEGICLLLRRIGPDSRPTFLYFPVGGEIPKRIRGRPRLYPEGAVFDCPACRSSRPWTDPRHTRNSEPPLLCKHYGRIPEYTCPGCVSGKSPDHPSHTREESSCRMPGVRVTGQRRTAGPARDPAATHYTLQ